MKKPLKLGLYALLILVGVALLLLPLKNGVSNHLIKNKYRSVLEEKLRDPASAQYRNEVLYLFSDDSGTLCGEVNSKNSFGGYTGFKRFMAYKKFAFIEDVAGDFGVVWENGCVKE